MHAPCRNDVEGSTAALTGAPDDNADLDNEKENSPRDVERTIACIVFEDEPYCAFKRTLTKNPAGAFQLPSLLQPWVLF